MLNRNRQNSPAGKSSFRPLLTAGALAGAFIFAPANAQEGLDLAKKSGCLTCHNVDTKVIGPSFKDIAAKYKGDAGAKAALIQSVKKGSQGKWTQVTGGVPMPPYSPRVADADIEKLIDFILAQAK